VGIWRYLKLNCLERIQKNDFSNGIAKFVAAALRFTLLSYTLGMKDINLDISRVEGYRRLFWNANKLSKMISSDKNLL
jgi:valyl-tRNA synthetase